MASARPTVLVGACAAAASVSLLFPATLGFDPWAWLVWGRQVGDLALDTTGGPSWKPLPIAASVALAPLGSAAVPAWMVVARTAALLAVVATYRLASRLAGPRAGALAVGLLLLTPDGGPRFLRLVGEAHIAPVSVTLALFAFERHLDRRDDHALLLVGALGLSRPEAWPFLLACAWWIWRRDRNHRVLVAVVLAAVPLLWFGLDWWGSGSPWHGADAAQVAASDSIMARTTEALSSMRSMVVAPAAVAAAHALWRRYRDRAEADFVARLAAIAVAWCAVILAMTVLLGYAALSRFFLPAAAAVCVLAGVGTVRFAASLRSRVLVVPAVLAVAAVLVAPRVAGIPDVLDEMTDREALEDDLDRVLALVPRSTLFACDDLAVQGSGSLRPAVAWKLDLPLDRVPLELADGSGVVLVRTGGRRDGTISGQDHAVPIVRTTGWSVIAVGCPAAAPLG